MKHDACDEVSLGVGVQCHVNYWVTPPLFGPYDDLGTRDVDKGQHIKSREEEKKERQREREGEKKETKR